MRPEIHDAADAAAAADDDDDDDCDAAAAAAAAAETQVEVCLLSGARCVVRWTPVCFTAQILLWRT